MIFFFARANPLKFLNMLMSGVNMNRDRAEHLLIEADSIAELVLGGFDMTIETSEGRALYDRAFTAYLSREIGDESVSSLYDALKGSTGPLAS